MLDAFAESVTSCRWVARVGNPSIPSSPLMRGADARHPGMVPAADSATARRTPTSQRKMCVTRQGSAYPDGGWRESCTPCFAVSYPSGRLGSVQTTLPGQVVPRHHHPHDVGRRALQHDYLKLAGLVKPSLESLLSGLCQPAPLGVSNMGPPIPHLDASHPLPCGRIDARLHCNDATTNR